MINKVYISHHTVKHFSKNKKPVSFWPLLQCIISHKYPLLCTLYFHIHYLKKINKLKILNKVNEIIFKCDYVKKDLSFKILQ